MARTVAVTVAVVVVLAAATTWEAVRLRATNRAWISLGAVPGWRGLRALFLRIALWFLSWPHALDRVLGTHRIAATAHDATLTARWPGAALYRYAAPARAAAPILVVHSLVTRPWILDLAPGCSLIEALLATRRPVYLLDWADPARDTATHGFVDKAQLLHAATETIAAETQQPTVDVLGYCSGATVALLAAAHDPRRMRSLALIAPMVDANVPGGMRPLMSSRWLLPALLLDEKGCVPAAAVREAFHLLRPMALRAARQRWRQRRDVDVRRLTGALTRWTWEQRDLPGGVFFDLVDMFRDNPLVGDGWPVGDARLDIRTIDVPTLIAVTDREHIVPIGSSLALTHLLKGPVTVTHCAGGHVSMVAGNDARSTLYPSLHSWYDGSGNALG